MRIQICDNGEGIDPEVRERLFEPFFTTRTKGTGLGLAIVRQIAELHGGGVELKDNRPCGTCVVLTLPQTPALVDETQGQDDAVKQGQTA
jgi:signal transduction histidine kinase